MEKGMGAKRQDPARIRKRNAGFAAFFISGICAISCGVVVSLLQERLGFDYISSTMRSYTAETEGIQIPDIEFLRKLQTGIRKAKIIAEGGIHSYEALSQVLDTGIDHIVIGGAITRPQEITKNYVQVFENNMTFKMNA